MLCVPPLPFNLVLQDSLRHALLQTEPTTQPVLLAFSEPDGSHVPFNPVEEMGQVGDVHLQQSTLMSHQCDLRGGAISCMALHMYTAHSETKRGQCIALARLLSR